MTAVTSTPHLAELLQTQTQPILIIGEDAQHLLRLEQDLKFFLSKNTPLLHFPDRETLPYDSFSPSEDLTSQRLTVLSQLPQLSWGIILTTVTTLMHYLPPLSFLKGRAFYFKQGDKIAPHALRDQLQECGYQAVSQVISPGEFAMRGAILDVYPMGAKQPLRLDLFDDEIESIRLFDTETQCTTQKIPQFQLLPAKEFATDKDAISLFRQQWRQQFSGDPTKVSIYESVSAGLFPAGIEYYLPLFFDKLATLFDYLPPNCQQLWLSDILPAAEQFNLDIQNRYKELNFSIKPLLAPEKVFLKIDQLQSHLQNLPKLSLPTHFSTALPDLSMHRHHSPPYAALQKFIEQHSGRILLCVESLGRREALLEILKGLQPQPIFVEDWQAFLNHAAPFAITIAPLDESLLFRNIAIITEAALFKHRIPQQRQREKSRNMEAVIRDLVELQPGALVVHLDQGIGRYLGLTTLTIDSQTQEFLLIEYQDNGKLYVPITSLHLLSRYGGLDPALVELSKLGTDQWAKAKRKAAEQVRDVAAELLAIYAKREARAGFSFNAPDDNYAEFAAAFPFEETADQSDAIQSIMEDMASDKPMDRLVCGDVGFGKTEVAMRAAFLAVASHKQVAVLVPTTLLAEQHLQTFRDRFAKWPVQIAGISRFKTADEQQKTLQKLEQGQIDIIIGTHKLLQNRVAFKNLGLVIIDEEHRFGVQQKEKLKSFCAEVDVLALTATPIPRTLNMALNHVRDLSIIATPPLKRLSVKTFVYKRNRGLIREAMGRELMRGGQIYFVHNAIESIEKVKQELLELMPQLKIQIGHGQMPERELERVMADFYHQRFQVLLCTTVIEAGIDIPTANTIIIDNADRFGLAQLHQMRGRVGRSTTQAYAYLFIHPEKPITPDAEKRLQAISELEQLGAGFLLATHDLEIRGAGELLGKEQSGQMQAIGFTLYLEILERAVKALKQGEKFDIDNPFMHPTEIDLQLPALIPEDYLSDTAQRLTLYRRIANTKSLEALDALQVEMIDRFGLLPAVTKNLIAITELRLQAEQLGIRKIEANASGGRIEFQKSVKFDPVKIIQLIQAKGSPFRLEGPERVKFTQGDFKPEQRIDYIKNLLGKFI